MVSKADLSPTLLGVFQTIEAYKVGDDLRETITEKLSGEYNKLRDMVCQWNEHSSIPPDLLAEDIESALKLAEDVWCEERYVDDPKYKHKDGSWKRRTLLPKGYSSAKSVILGAIKVGVLDNVSSKSALERKIKEAISKSIVVESVDTTIEKLVLDLESKLDKLLGYPTPDPFILGSICGKLYKLTDKYGAIASALYGVGAVSGGSS